MSEENYFTVWEKNMSESVDLADYPWDVLIILDACRYDIFEEVYSQYLPAASLKKAYSPATHTPEFLYKCFKDKYMDDTIYISGNMFINSKNIPLDHWDSHLDFNPTPHFKRVIDVWDTGFVKEKGTIVPSEMNKYAMASMDLNKTSRFIIHYMQPHAPFLTWGGDASNIKAFWKEQGGDKEKPVHIRVWEQLVHRAFGIFSERTMWTISKLLGRLPEGGRGDLYFTEGREGYIRHYTNNLEIVLAHVRKLVKRYRDKKFLITSDHGDRLGEKGNYGHSKIHKRDRIILEVPWAEVGF